MRAKIFVDFWNFQLDWNDIAGKDGKGKPIYIPWRDTFPKVIIEEVSKKHGEKLTYSGVHVYASVDPDGDASLRKFLHAMDSFPGYSVTVKERKARKGTIRCSSCQAEVESCPSCKQRLRRTVEKGIDAAIITDIIQMGYDGIYDVGVLASGDADLAQAITFIQNRIGKQFYNLWFTGRGVSVRNACWDHVIMTELLSPLGCNIPPVVRK